MYGVRFLFKLFNLFRSDQIRSAPQTYLPEFSIASFTEAGNTSFMDPDL
jgi:hypothetical protein